MSQNRKYVRIVRSDYQAPLGVIHDDKFFAYTDNYFIKNDIDYEIDGMARLVYVQGRIDALRIGRDLRLQTLEYFDGSNSQTVKLTKQALKHRRQIAYVENSRTEAKQTLKQFKKNTPDRLSNEFIPKSEIIKMKLATKATLDKLIAENKIHVTEFRNRYFIDRTELAKALLAKK